MEMHQDHEIGLEQIQQHVIALEERIEDLQSEVKTLETSLERHQRFVEQMLALLSSGSLSVRTQGKIRSALQRLEGES